MVDPTRIYKLQPGPSDRTRHCNPYVRAEFSISRIIRTNLARGKGVSLEMRLRAKEKQPRSKSAPAPGQLVLYYRTTARVELSDFLDQHPHRSLPSNLSKGRKRRRATVGQPQAGLLSDVQAPRSPGAPERLLYALDSEPFPNSRRLSPSVYHAGVRCLLSAYRSLSPPLRHGFLRQTSPIYSFPGHTIK
jgi:hypothetical protein